jgi:hypothetical protein
MNYDRKVLYKKLYKTMNRFDNLVTYFASEKANGNFKKYIIYRGKYYDDFYKNILENFFDEIRDRRKDDILSDFGALLKNSFDDLTNEEMIDYTSYEELEDLLERMENYIIDFIDYENGYY